MATPRTFDLGDFELSTDPARLDLDRVEQFLRASYWAHARSRDAIERSIAGSTSLGLYRKSDGLQVGFCRVVTDAATFGWVTDVFVDEAFRGRKLGERMVGTLIGLPELEGLQLALATADAQGLYARFGFERLPLGNGWMSRRGNEPPHLR